MADQGSDDLQAVLVPIASLMSKSEKAREKVAPGTWQHTMLTDNLRALRIATALIGGGGPESDDLSTGDLEEALRSIGSMISRTETAQIRFVAGTSQHTLLRNRLAALRAAEAAVRARSTQPRHER